MKSSLTIKLISGAACLLLSASACTPRPEVESRLIDTWGKQLYPTTNMESIYPPRGGVFPGDVIALCADPPKTSASGSNARNETTNEATPHNKAKIETVKQRFDAVTMGRFSTFDELIYTNLLSQPRFKQSTSTQAAKMSIIFGNRNVHLPTVAFPTSSFVGQSNVGVGLTGSAKGVKGGAGFDRTNTAYYMLSITNAGQLSLPYPLALEAIKSSAKSDPENSN